MAIVSYSRNFIFVKTRKTAGTSIEVELSRRLGPRDVVTPLFPPEPGHDPRNYKFLGFQRFNNHMPATRIRRQIGARRFNAMFKFCVEREPLDKTISHFRMKKNMVATNGFDQSITWEDYVERGYFPIDIEKYTDMVDGRRQLIVDRIIPYETLKEGLCEVLAAQGMEDFQLGTRAKSGYSAVRHIEKQDVTEAQKAKIYAAFAETMALTGLYSDPTANQQVREQAV